MPPRLDDQQTFDIFVSYAESDNADDAISECRGGWVTALVEALKAERRSACRLPLRIYFEAERGENEGSGTSLTALLSSKLMLAVVSPAYLASERCRHDWEWFVADRLGHARRHMVSSDQSDVDDDDAPPVVRVLVNPVDLVGSGDDTGDPQLPPEYFHKSNSISLAEWIAALDLDTAVDMCAWREEGCDALLRESARPWLQRIDDQIEEQLGDFVPAGEVKSNVLAPITRFRGRQTELDCIHGSLAARQNPVVIYGPGGIGKTALTLEYAKRYRDEYLGGRYFMPCGGLDDVRQMVIELADVIGLQLGQLERNSLALGAAAVREFFARGARSDRRLVVLDNVDQAALLTGTAADGRKTLEWVHTELNADCLVTTRLSPDELGVPGVVLQGLDENESAAVLNRWRPISLPTDRMAAMAIGRRCNGLPLALEIAGLHLVDAPNLSVANYYVQLNANDDGASSPTSSSLQLAAADPIALVGRMLEPTLTALDALQLRALEHAAFMDPDWVGLPWIAQLANNAFTATRNPSPVESPSRAGQPESSFVQTLFARGLLVSTYHKGIARLPRMLGEVVRARLGRDAGRLEERRAQTLDWVRRRIEWLRTGWGDRGDLWMVEPATKLATRALAECLLGADATNAEDAAAQTANFRSLAIDLAIEVAQLLNRLGYALRAKTLLLAAKRVLDGHTSGANPGGPSSNVRARSLALIDWQLAMAELGLTTSTVEPGAETALRGESTRVTDGDSERAHQEIALSLFEQALSICRGESPDGGKIDPDDPLPDDIGVALASCEWTQGLVERVAALLEQNIAAVVAAMAAENQQTTPGSAPGSSSEFVSQTGRLALKYADLGLLKARLGEPERARALLMKAIELDEPIYGSDHPVLARHYTKLSSVEQSLGRSESSPNTPDGNQRSEPGSREWLERAIAILEADGPQNDLELGVLYGNLAMTEINAGNLDRARELTVRARKIRVKYVGVDDIDVAINDGRLAIIAFAQGRLEESEAVGRRAIKILARAVPPEHRFMIAARFALSKVLFAQGGGDPNSKQGAEGLAVARDVHRLCTEHYGLDHQTTQGVGRWLAQNDPTFEAG